jgi:hypothetical protein
VHKPGDDDDGDAAASDGGAAASDGEGPASDDDEGAASDGGGGGGGAEQRGRGRPPKGGKQQSKGGAAGRQSGKQSGTQPGTQSGTQSGMQSEAKSGPKKHARVDNYGALDKGGWRGTALAGCDAETVFLPTGDLACPRWEGMGGRSGGQITGGGSGVLVPGTGSVLSRRLRPPNPPPIPPTTNHSKRWCITYKRGKSNGRHGCFGRIWHDGVQTTVVGVRGAEGRGGG